MPYVSLRTEFDVSREYDFFEQSKKNLKMPVQKPGPHNLEIYPLLWKAATAPWGHFWEQILQ